MHLSGLFLLAALWALPIVSGTNVHVIGLRCQEDEATLRFSRSAEVLGYSYDEIDLSQFANTTGEVTDGEKLLMVKQYIDEVRIEDADNILIVDSQSSVLLIKPTDLIQAAESLTNSFIFNGGNSKLETDRPSASQIFNGMFAKTGQLKAAFPAQPEIPNAAFAEAFIDNIVNDSHPLVDVDSKFFQQIGSNISDIKIRFKNDNGYLQHSFGDVIPAVAVASLGGKVKLNSLSNYLARSWSPEGGCLICDEEKIDLASIKMSEFPVVQLSVFVSEPTPFLQLFFERLANLSYPKDRLHLTVHCKVPEQQKIVDSFLKQHGPSYRSMFEINAEKYFKQDDAFKMASSQCLSKSDCEKFLFLDATVQFTLVDALQQLVSANRSIVAPVMTRHKAYWSTFWGDVDEEDSYLRSHDYIEIIDYHKIGLWNVPLVGSVFLMSRRALSEVSQNLISNEFLYYAISKTAFQKNIFLFVDNRVKFGHLINETSMTLSHVNNDLWQNFDNPLDWEERYIHKEYFKLTNASTKMADFEQPCPDIFHVPLMTELFCQQLIEELENFGNWSDGSNYDSRLEGGYENVPTRDIHMRQIDWEKNWLHVLTTYVYPIQIKIFEGYTDQPWARMNFVVRYKQDEQPSLDDHYDASTYTLDMALNRPKIDYEGGGVRFSRYNCTLLDTRPGWSLIFPGRLTHIHEGLETTKGIRYIFVTFVNP